MLLKYSFLKFFSINTNNTEFNGKTKTGQEVFSPLILLLVEQHKDTKNIL